MITLIEDRPVLHTTACIRNSKIFFELTPLGVNSDTSHFLKYGLRTEKGQAKEDNFLYSLPFLFCIFLSIQFSPV